MALRWAYSRPDGGVDIVQAMRREDLALVIGKTDRFGNVTLSDEDYRAFVFARSVPEWATDVIEIPEDWVEPSRDYRSAWIISNGAIAVDPVRKAAALIPRIKDEAQRRIIALTGQSDLTSSMIKQSNANMRATELTDKRVGGGTLTAEEEAEAAALRGLAEKIKAVRAASNVLEQSPPDNYADDEHWPT